MRYAISMLYNQYIIYALRPWMFRRNVETQPHPSEKHNPEQARVMCIDATTSIAKLLQAYERRYGLRRISRRYHLLGRASAHLRYRHQSPNTSRLCRGLDPSGTSRHLLQSPRRIRGSMGECQASQRLPNPAATPVGATGSQAP